MTLDVGGILFNRYRIEAIIAQGGMGAIYRANDQSLGVRVAVKENLFSSEESSRQFRREATILASLRHPNLPRVTDHFVIPNQGQYLVMDYIEGEDLRQRMNRRSFLSEEEAILIGTAICDALTYLHNRPAPVLHRDIKPSNIKVAPSGQVFLVDFGLAKISQPGQATTIGAQALTPGYAPPEQYGQGTDTRSDIYSLGATLYAAITGVIPEDGLSRAMGSVQLTPIRQHNPQISDPLAQVIEKAMAVSQNDRYQTAEEFKRALLGANTAARRKTMQMGEIRLSPQPSVAPPVPQQPTAQVTAAPTAIAQPQPAEASQPRKGAPYLALIGGLLAAGLICASVVVILYVSGKLGFHLPTSAVNQVSTITAVAQSTPASTPQPSPVPTEEPAPTEAPLQSPTEIPPVFPTATPELPTPTSTIAATPQGGGQGKIAFASNQAGGLPQIWIMNVDGTGQQQITDFKDGACQPDWSPDGKRLVIVSPCRGRQDIYKGSSLFLINSDGTGLTPLASVPGGDFEPAWSPDGKKIAFTSIRVNNIPYIFLYDLETNSASRVTNTSTNERYPAWSPDGKLIAFESTRLGTSQIWVMEANGKSPREFSSLSNGAAFKPAFSPNGATISFSQGSQLPWLISKQYPADPTTPEFKISDFRPVVHISYSPDGFWMAFESSQEGNLDIYLIASLTGANLTRLTDDPGDQFNPDWQP